MVKLSDNKELWRLFMSKTKSGFTLMELTIVLAVLAIIAAILVPLFLRTTDRARLRSDIQSARVIQNAMDLYRVEQGRAIAGGSTNIDDILTGLQNAGYLNPRNANTQTDNAVWVIVGVNREVRLDISGTDEGVRATAATLSQEERDMMVGVPQD